jgi:predicted acyl esterase
VFGKQGLPNAVRKVLTFTTPPLREDLEVTGPIVLRLWLASDQLDTGVYVTISDQDPGNLVSRAVSQMLDVGPQAVAVTRGWLKASHRRLDPARSTDYRPFHPHIDPEPPEPGHPTKLMIEVWPTSWVFRRGLRIRLQLAPGDSPAFDPFYHHYNMKQHDE